MDARIVGWGHTNFGRHPQSLEELIVNVTRQAVAHANVSYADIDGIWLGHYNSGLVSDGFAASLVLHADEALRFTPAVRVENACASGSAAIYAARSAIRAGDCKIALVVGAEKMTDCDTKAASIALAGASYQKEEAGVTFPEIFAKFAQEYNETYGDCGAALAHIAAKNHTNAMLNPRAHMHRDMGFEACNTVSEKNPIIAPPLRLTDCSLISDGAAALIMVADDIADSFAHNIKFRAAVHVNDYLPMSRRDVLAFEGPTQAFNLAFERAGVQLADLDFAEIHDCFTIAELLIYEAMGLTPRGQGATALSQGTVYRDGALPINLSGGLKAKGHPVGATGVSMHVMAAEQLSGVAGTLQKRGVELGMVFNMGGSGVANYCSILENGA